jgi:hypothetical protein
MDKKSLFNLWYAHCNIQRTPKNWIFLTVKAGVFLVLAFCWHNIVIEVPLELDNLKLGFRGFFCIFLYYCYLNVVCGHEQFVYLHGLFFFFKKKLIAHALACGGCLCLLSGRYETLDDWTPHFRTAFKVSRRSLHGGPMRVATKHTIELKRYFSPPFLFFLNLEKICNRSKKKKIKRVCYLLSLSHLILIFLAVSNFIYLFLSTWSFDFWFLYLTRHLIYDVSSSTLNVLIYTLDSWFFYQILIYF